MNLKTTMCTAVALFAVLHLPITVADTVSGKAICEFYNHGDMKKDRTGPCSMTRAGGEVDIELYNGTKYIFTPEEKREGRYIDQDGNRLAVEKNADWKYTYKWKNQRLIVMHPGH